MKSALTSFKLFLPGLLLALTLPARLCAQSPMESEEVQEVKKNVVEQIMEQSNGNVSIDFSDRIIERIEEKPSAPKKTQHTNTRHNRTGIHKQQGYRIQVFNDGRNQSTLQARAKARGNAIASKFPKYRGQVYTFSSSPNWFTRVGNFATQSEANAAMVELKRAFPSFAGEMRVVKSQVVIIK